MSFFGRLFGKREQPLPPDPPKGRPFGSSDREIEEFFASWGQVMVGDEEIIITGYPFKPSLAFGYKVIEHDEVRNIDLNGFPPSLLVGNELIFVSAEHKETLKAFAEENKIKTETLPDIWGWILEPFLDTEFTPEHEERLNGLLAGYRLTAARINQVRNEVNEQMYKYNFDTLLWNWTGFSTIDVLLAMRPKYNEERFRTFYKEVMEIALLSPLKDENQ